MKHVRKRLTYANVMSSIAVFLILGGATALAAGHLGKNSVGTKQIKNNAVTTAKIKNGAVTGAKVNAGTLATVPSATNATHAVSADSATKATSATDAAHATSADTAANANALGGRAPSGYATTQLEAEHVVGKPGEPTFESGCTNITPGEVTEVGFYKDPFGVVHLRGYVVGCTGGTVFTLPAGFRPKEREFFAGATGNTTAGLITVNNEGVVETFGGTEHGLGNVEFRTDG